MEMCKFVFLKHLTVIRLVVCHKEPRLYWLMNTSQTFQCVLWTSLYIPYSCTPKDLQKLVRKEKLTERSLCTASDTRFLCREFSLQLIHAPTTPPPIQSASPPPKLKLVYFLYLTKGSDRINHREAVYEAVSQWAPALSHLSDAAVWNHHIQCTGQKKDIMDPRVIFCFLFLSK